MTQSENSTRRLAADGYNLIVVGRRQERLQQLASEFSAVEITPLVVDLGKNAGIRTGGIFVPVSQSSCLLITRLWHIKWFFVDLPYEKADELLHVKVLTTTMLIDHSELFSAVSEAGLTAFTAQSPTLSARYR